VHSDLEFWSLVLALSAAVVPWAFSVHAKVAIIAHSVESLPEMFEELRHMLQEHESRLNDHDKAIASLKETPSSRH